MFFYRFPFYYELKIIFVVWLLSPATKGSSVLYRKFVHPELLKREQVSETGASHCAAYLYRLSGVCSCHILCQGCCCWVIHPSLINTGYHNYYYYKGFYLSVAHVRAELLHLMIWQYEQKIVLFEIDSFLYWGVWPCVFMCECVYSATDRFQHFFYDFPCTSIFPFLVSYYISNNYLKSNRVHIAAFHTPLGNWVETKSLHTSYSDIIVVRCELWIRRMCYFHIVSVFIIGD